MKTPIYLDYNGTSPLDPEVIAAMRPFLEEEFGNPSSSHWFGIAPKKAVELSRHRVASLLNCDPQEIIFTSGGTESNNYALLGIAHAKRDKGNHIITSRIEHPSVLEVCRDLEKRGFDVTYLPVDEYGLVSPFLVENAITPQTILLTIMHANNEVGSIQPIEEISPLARNRGITFHTDAAQTVGKIPAVVDVLGVDLLSVAGHKLYAPKGIGALYVRAGTEPRQLMFGAGQEKGRRPGTENVLEIVGLGKACEIAQRDLDVNASHLKKMRDLLHDGLRARIQHVRLNGHPDKRLPNTLNLSFKNVDSTRILEEIGLDVAVSAGAACHSDHITVSHVLEAMAVPLEWAKGTLRFSVGKFTTEAEIVRTIDIVSDTVKRLSPI
jgi:cysteine desulfurase